MQSMTQVMLNTIFFMKHFLLFDPRSWGTPVTIVTQWKFHLAPLLVIVGHFITHSRTSPALPRSFRPHVTFNHSLQCNSYINQTSPHFNAFLKIPSLPNRLSYFGPLLFHVTYLPYSGPLLFNVNYLPYSDQVSIHRNVHATHPGNIHSSSMLSQIIHTSINHQADTSFFVFHTLTQSLIRRYNLPSTITFLFSAQTVPCQ